MVFDMEYYVIMRDDGKCLNSFNSFEETSIKIWKTEYGCRKWFKAHLFVDKNLCKVKRIVLQPYSTIHIDFTEIEEELFRRLLDDRIRKNINPETI